MDLSHVTFPLARAQLELLLALLALGLSVSEACSRLWIDLNLPRRILTGYRGRSLTLGVEAVAVTEALLELRPRLHGGQRLLGWQSATARKWLKQVRRNA